MTRIFTDGHLGMYLININNGDSFPIASIQRPNNQRPHGYVSFGDLEVPSVRGLGSVESPPDQLPGGNVWPLSIAFLKHGETEEDVLHDFSEGQSGRRYFGLNQPWRPLLVAKGGEFYVAQPMFETTHRPAGAWEKDGPNPFEGNPNAPRMFMIRK